MANSAFARITGLMPSAAASAAKPRLFTVRAVTDGDTIRLSNNQRARLVQIDAPETSSECYGNQAKNVLAGLLPVGTKVKLQSDPGLDDVDRYPADGKILFVSGRGGPADNDSSADVYILSGPGGTVHSLTSADGQHRHPDWSPDLKRVAYALWASASDRDIWIHDLVDGSRSRGDTIGANVSDDRPA